MNDFSSSWVTLEGRCRSLPGFKRYVLFVALISMLCVPSAYCSDGTMEEKLFDYVDWFHRNMDQKYAEKAKRLVPVLLKYSNKYKVDPFLMAQTFSSESSWRKFEGKLGERGPGHVMPGKWVDQFDLETMDGQVEASAFLWRMALDKCISKDPLEHIEMAFTHYVHGGCVSKSDSTRSKVKLRIRKYRKAVAMFKVTVD